MNEVVLSIAGAHTIAAATLDALVTAASPKTFDADHAGTIPAYHMSVAAAKNAAVAKIAAVETISASTTTFFFSTEIVS